jgi:hypothetical protein
MGSAFVVLGAFYCPAVGKLAAVAKAAAYMEFPAMGVANPLYRRGGSGPAAKIRPPALPARLGRLRERTWQPRWANLDGSSGAGSRLSQYLHGPPSNY